MKRVYKMYNGREYAYWCGKRVRCHVKGCRGYIYHTKAPFITSYFGTIGWYDAEMCDYCGYYYFTSKDYEKMRKDVIARAGFKDLGPDFDNEPVLWHDANGFPQVLAYGQTIGSGTNDLRGTNTIWIHPWGD